MKELRKGNVEGTWERKEAWNIDVLEREKEVKKI
jgi:hypothetical protein